MERQILFQSKPIRDTTVLCDMNQCDFNDRGLCLADSVAIIGGKCGLDTTRPEAYHEDDKKIQLKSSDNVNTQSEVSEEQTKRKRRRVRVFEGTDWC